MRSKRRLFDDFLKIDEMTVAFQQTDGQMSPHRRVLVLERGDAVAALLFDRGRGEVIAIEQFRAPTLGKGQGGGWLLEAAAGMLEPGETPEQALAREVHEETGYEVSRLTPVATFFSSPGGSSERIFLYCAEVTAAQQVGAGGGVAGEGENIRLVRLGLAELRRRLDALEFEDPKLIIAGQWLLGSLAARS